MYTGHMQTSQSLQDHLNHTNSDGTLTSALKGGDYVELGGKVVEVFDTFAAPHNGTVVRWIDGRGEVHSLRTFAPDRLRRVETLTALRKAARS
jgi:hypothetical protein